MTAKPICSHLEILSFIKRIPEIGIIISRRGAQQLQQGIYLGPAGAPGLYSIRLFPSEREEFVTLDCVCRRHVKPRKIYIIQRYNGIVDMRRIDDD